MARQFVLLACGAEELSIKRRIDESTRLTLLWHSAHYCGIAKWGLPINHKALARHLQEMGLTGDLSCPQSEPSCPQSCGLPLSAARIENQRGQSGLGRGQWI